MAFDQAWELIFKSQIWGKYPSEDIVRFIASRFKDVTDRKSIRVMDLGCGGGAHTWFLAREGFDVYGIDGSESAIRQASALLDRDGLTANLTVGDFTQLDYPAEFFDVVIDSSAIQHNNFENICLIHRQIWDSLKPGGYFCGILINTGTSGWETAEKIEENTYTNFKKGPIQKELLVHFFTESEIREIMADYELLNLEKTTRTVGNGKDQYGHFIVNGRKPV